MPARHFSKVLLPLPFRPAIPKNSPGATANDTSCSASKVRLLTFLRGCSARSLSVCRISSGTVKVFDTDRAATTGSRSPPTAEVGMQARVAKRFADAVGLIIC